MSTPMRVATRSSRLARVQAALIIDLLAFRWPGMPTETIEFGTSGDRDQVTPCAALRADAFIDDIEAALRRGAVDVAVHSWKDLPRASATDLVVAAIPLRADPREALVARGGLSLAQLPAGATIGTSSARRAEALRQLRPDCVLRPIRGPVDARVEQVMRGDFDAALFAAAGLIRLGLESRISEYFDIAVLAPAAGQGALAVQCRAVDLYTIERIVAIDDPALHARVLAEREHELAGSDA